jgi:hypothetical protein
MNYFNLFQLLKNKVGDDGLNFVRIDEATNLYNFDFESNSYQMLPGVGRYQCDRHAFGYEASYDFENDLGASEREVSLDIADARIAENQRFRYHVFHPSGKEKARQIVFMFHGFNEKNWLKYLPWAKTLSEHTGKTIVCFPIAFHMNRAPHEWSDRRKMYAVSELRRCRFPHILHSTLSNVAISTRLHSRPQRFFWSGLQTYNDVIQLTESIKAGEHPLIAPDAGIDFFAYSIGCLLAEILMMTNLKGYFDRSRLFMFCGGAVFNRLSPASKFILDSEAGVALYSFAIEHLENHLKKDPRLRHYLGDAHPEGVYFRSMLNYGKMVSHREDAFRCIGPRMMALALENDTVIPPYEVINTLQGVKRNLPAQVKVINFPYEYKHEDPFPVRDAIAGEVSRQFRRVFKLAGDFLA